ncbi:hypothetical protein B0H14DRAFT_2578934 [Mycena olivaceomarginata]|nr:hypothetical protein B0H14DRAFT_2578934 [Mycena olivaceomarginata]
MQKNVPETTTLLHVDFKLMGPLVLIYDALSRRIDPVYGDPRDEKLLAKKPQQPPGSVRLCHGPCLNGQSDCCRTPEQLTIPGTSSGVVEHWQHSTYRPVAVQIPLSSGHMDEHNSAFASSPSIHTAPRVKMTPWRIINTSVLLSLGSYKAVSVYLGQTSAPNSLDWTIGVLWAVISYWVSILEQEAPTLCPFLFTYDLTDTIGSGLAAFLTIVIASLLVGFLWTPFMRLHTGSLVLVLIFYLIFCFFLGLILAIAEDSLIAWAARGYRHILSSQRRFLPTSLKKGLSRFYNELFRRSDWVVFDHWTVMLTIIAMAVYIRVGATGHLIGPSWWESVRSVPPVFRGLLASLYGSAMWFFCFIAAFVVSGPLRMIRRLIGRRTSSPPAPTSLAERTWSIGVVAWAGGAPTGTTHGAAWNDAVGKVKYGIVVVSGGASYY